MSVRLTCLLRGKLFVERWNKGFFTLFILWGPPGTGKTGLAQLFADLNGINFIPISAVSGGMSDIRAAVQSAQKAMRMSKQRSLVFVDEVHPDSIRPSRMAFLSSKMAPSVLLGHHRESLLSSGIQRCCPAQGFIASILFRRRAGRTSQNPKMHLGTITTCEWNWHRMHEGC